ncbi:pilus assembly protein [Pseudoxanthomonas suwonensis]|uniref:pilus assembly protein n=1 Tax=Pseudoxanthomonas suwonensis TaxID=314722 RepID=UPI00046466DA|nr:PilC/PilY family type IV pilus protein [Pseudoxanthomonas suwonensis]
MKNGHRPGPRRASRLPGSRVHAFAVGLLAAFCSMSAISGVAIDHKPLTVTNSVPGNMVLLPSVEWPTVVTHANSPGVEEADANYSSSTAYAGYFNTELCYAYHYDAVEANRYFYPVAAAASRSCSGLTASNGQRLWSGNFMNWAAMQAADTFRLALTGGYRVHRPADGTPPSVTITGADGTSVTKATSEMPGVTYLEKANSDRWSNYTPLRRLSSGAGSVSPVQTGGIRLRIGGLRNQMWFIPSSDGGLGSAQSWNDPKALSLPVTSGYQASPAGTSVTAVPYNPSVHTLPNANTTCPSSYSYSSAKALCTRNKHSDETPTAYGKDAVYAVSVRVQVCDGVLDTRSLCTRYGQYYKPEGLLQANAKKTRYSLFSYLTQSGQSRNGGVMRARQKLIGPVTAAETSGAEKPYPDRTGRISGIDNPEWDPVTGVIINDPDSTDSSATSSRIGTCGTSSNDPPDGSGCVVRYSGVINYLNRFGQIHTGMTTLKAYDNLSEMYYTALRYLRGVGNIADYSSLSGTAKERYQNADGLPVIQNWYHTGDNASVTLWTTGNRTVGTDADPMLYRCQANVFLGIGDTATNNEDGNHSGNGDIESNFTSTWLGYTEGNNTSQNYTAALAYWAHITDIRPDIPNTVLSVNPDRKRGQSISTYWVDVVELNDLKARATNQYYLATKYGGYTISEDSYQANGNAQRRDTTWFTNNRSAWSSATQTAKNQTGLGGTGDFYLPNNMYLANNGEAMIQGLNAAFQKIADDISGSGGSFASNTTKLEVGSRTYQAKYISNGWGGRLTASNVDTATGNLTEVWDASDWLGQAAGDAKINGNATTLDYTQRKIFYNNNGSLANFISNWSGSVLSSPTLVKPGSLSTLTDNQLKYILGDRTHERQSTVDGSQKIFRNRRGMLGDIINSTPVYVGRPNANLYAGDSTYASFATAQGSRTPVVYVGANDGMLHAFKAPDSCTGANAECGKELFAFMPTEAMNVLKQNDPATNKYPYWDPEYDHAYSVDGEITVADVKDGNTWKTVLVGTMGRGGKTIFALDVTNPASPALLWEKTASDAAVGSYLGNALGRPIIAKVADGDWRVFLGNGPNSTSGQSALIMLDVMSGENANTKSTGSGGDNGLSAVNVWDDHGTLIPSKPDGNFDTVYAGDMNGNLWKFNLDDNTVTKLFTTQTGQPITAAPLVARNPYNPPETWVFFGTGRYLSMADTSAAANAITQSWYGIIDRDATVTLNTLNRSSITHQDNIGRVIEKVGAPGTNGWYIDLEYPAGTPNGERMVLPNFFQGMALIGTTRYPDSTDPCAPSGRGYTMAIDPFTGGRLGSAFFDMNGNGTVGDSGDYYGGNTSTPYSGVGYDSGPNNPIFLGPYMYTSLDSGSYSKIMTSGAQALVRRVSWRELLNAN